MIKYRLKVNAEKIGHGVWTPNELWHGYVILLLPLNYAVYHTNS